MNGIPTGKRDRVGRMICIGDTVRYGSDESYEDVPVVLQDGGIWLDFGSLHPLAQNDSSLLLVVQPWEPADDGAIRCECGNKGNKKCNAALSVEKLETLPEGIIFSLLDGVVEEGVYLEPDGLEALTARLLHAARTLREA